MKHGTTILDAETRENLVPFSFIWSITDDVNSQEQVNTTLLLCTCQPSVWMLLYLMIPSPSGLEKFKLRANPVMPPFNQTVKTSPACFWSTHVFFSEMLLDCNLFDLFDVCLISLEETEEIRCGNWSLDHGTLTTQIVLCSVYFFKFEILSAWL